MASATVTLDVAVTPVEVYGGHSIASVTQSLYLPTAPNGTVTLEIQVHNVRWDGQASVKVNNMTPTVIDNTNCYVPNTIVKMWGGITGGFDVVTCRILRLPPNSITQGANTITWYYNGTDGRVAGYRVLSFQLIDSTPTSLIPAAEFYYTPPSSFVAPYTDQTNITAGHNLFTSGTLSGYVNGSYVTLNAHCSSCHVADLKNGAEDGYDLRYFNYSPYVIRQRSMFHGLTQKEGDQIASYILSLTSQPNPGLPWNPPYQPGSGLDSGPISSWSAGAGLSAVAVDDSAMGSNCLSGMSSWTQSTYVNSRETCIDLQLPTWNAWLPEVAPQDAWPGNTTDTCSRFPTGDPRHCEAFTSDAAYNCYTTIASKLQPSASSYSENLLVFAEWQSALYTRFLTEGVGGYWNSVGWTQPSRQSIYSAARWGMVKQWELNQLFGLEGYSSTAFAGFSPERAAWYGNAAFITSPNLQHIPYGPGLGNGTDVALAYLSYAWYTLELILNDGNGSLAGNNPIDYPYVTAYIYSDGTIQRLNEYMYWSWKALQGEAAHYANTGKDPSYGSLYGIAWSYLSPQFILDKLGVIGHLTNSQVLALTQPYLYAWYNTYSTFTASQYCSGGWISNCTNGPSSDDPANLSPVFLGGALWYMLPGYYSLGVDRSLIINLQNFGAALYPQGSWDRYYQRRGNHF
jgi:mono/diheme cytochrome c family protein